MDNLAISNLAKRVLAKDILSEATEFKEEIVNVVKTPRNAFDFATQLQVVDEDDDEDDYEDEPRQRGKASLEPIEEKEPYDAEKNARGLVGTLQAVDALVLSSACYFKVRSDFGGSRAIKKMKMARNKSYTTLELTPMELKLVERLAAFDKKVEKVTDGIFPKPAETNRLIIQATDFCEDTKFEMSSATAFWANYAGTLVGRFTKILME